MKRIVLIIIYVFIVLIYIFSPFIIYNKIFLHQRISYGTFVRCQKDNNNFIVVEYYIDNKVYELVLNADLLKNNKIKLICDSRNPKDVIPYTFAGLYANKKMLAIHLLFIFLTVIFITYNQTRKIEPNEEDLE